MSYPQGNDERGRAICRACGKAIYPTDRRWICQLCGAVVHAFCIRVEGYRDTKNSCQACKREIEETG